MKKRKPSYKGERKRKELRLPVRLAEKAENIAKEKGMTFNELLEFVIISFMEENN